MKIAKLCYDPSFCNTYVLGEEGEPALIIDPGYNHSGALNRYITKHHGGKILAIALTHGHFDHFAGMAEMEDLSSFPTFLSEEDYPCLTDAKKNASFDLSEPFLLKKDINPYFIEDEDEIKIGPYLFRVLHTPFHTKGSCCFYFEDEGILFTGDALFRLGVGRDDLPHAEPRSKQKSLAKIFALPKETKIYPGHGPSSSLAAETPYLRNYLLI